MTIRNESFRDELKFMSSEAEKEHVMDLLRKASRNDKKQLGYAEIPISHESTVEFLQNEGLSVVFEKDGIYKVVWN